MNCPKCDAPIDYRFCTDCPQCESELTPIGPAQDCVSTSQCKEFKLSPGDHVANAVLVLMCSGLGSVLGAVMSYLSCGAVYLMLFRSTGNGSLDCSRGTAVAVLSILFGGLIGGSGGSVLGYRNRPVCAPPAS